MALIYHLYIESSQIYTYNPGLSPQLHSNVTQLSARELTWISYLPFKFNMLLIEFIILGEDSNCTPAVTISETGTTTHIISSQKPECYT